MSDATYPRIGPSQPIDPLFEDPYADRPACALSRYPPQYVDAWRAATARELRLLPDWVDPEPPHEVGL